MAKADGPPITVRLAVETYVAERDARDSKRVGREKRSDAAQRLGRYVLGQGAAAIKKRFAEPRLADVALYTLKDDDLQKWRDGLPETMKATAKQRLVNDLKAALNAAYAANRKKLPPTLPGVIKHGLKAVNGGDENEPLARDNQILTDAQIGRLFDAGTRDRRRTGLGRRSVPAGRRPGVNGRTLQPGRPHEGRRRSADTWPAHGAR